ncbi:MAG: 23S rRNA (adenine(2503)-C(2))-methyltransferase RlmN [Flavobacteriales bacterium]|nr:23S rRNA (adenine(2503)-C(2))-methyltransferase RlmN [Flavobacteriales bacterium]|tara:strand:- start:17706 stop:18740 length:1035 start_codon:yes stop_codon:yes gene_type:complete
MKKDIRNISQEELEQFFSDNNLQKFRLKQLQEWLWKKGANSFDQMTSLSKELRELLKNSFDLKAAVIDKEFTSSDGTIKYSLKLHDDKLIEGVLIPSRKRVTACVSSQIGCSLACTFCATGTLKLSRNLTHGEIFDQVFKLNQESVKNHGRPLTNIVFMGMGEPLLNYNSLLKAIEKIISVKGMGISPKRITVSTAGLSKQIMKLADDKVKFNLAISLHSAIDEVRSELMPINDSINLDSLKKSIRYFYEQTNNRVTYEYILFKGVNDDLDAARRLASFCRISPCKVNLIEYNSVEGLDFEKSTNENTEEFIQFLEHRNIIVNLRRSKGKDIDAACGQLVNKLQ